MSKPKAKRATVAKPIPAKKPAASPAAPPPTAGPVIEATPVAPPAEHPGPRGMQNGFRAWQSVKCKADEADAKIGAFLGVMDGLAVVRFDSDTEPGHVDQVFAIDQIEAA